MSVASSFVPQVWRATYNGLAVIAPIKTRFEIASGWVIPDNTENSFSL
jgi:hypothetical protein